MYSSTMRLSSICGLHGDDTEQLHHDIRNIPLNVFRNIFLWKLLYACSHHDIQIFLWLRKNYNIYSNTWDGSYTYILLVVPIIRFINFLELQSTGSISIDKWSWFCALQYNVKWIVLRNCYTCNIHKISLSETIDFYFSLQCFRNMPNFKIFSATLFETNMPQYE